MKKSIDTLGDRMKLYEDTYRFNLTPRIPIIIRIDGKAFHSYTKTCKKPIDQSLIDCMDQTAIYLCKNIQGCQIGFVQSDEISLLLKNYSTFESQPWFNNTLQKVVSVSAGMASAMFTTLSPKIFGSTKLAVFDSRVFILPKEEVCNYFIWRQQDAIRNSIQMLARSLYSHKDCNNKDISELSEMCVQKGTDWNNCPTFQKRGRCIVKVKNVKTWVHPGTGQEVTAERTEWIVNNEIPTFSLDRDFIDQYI